MPTQITMSVATMPSMRLSTSSLRRNELRASMGGENPEGAGRAACRQKRGGPCEQTDRQLLWLSSRRSSCARVRFAVRQAGSVAGGDLAGRHALAEHVLGDPAGLHDHVQIVLGDGDRGQELGIELGATGA